MSMKIKKVDDKPMVIHTKKKMNIHKAEVDKTSRMIKQEVSDTVKERIKALDEIRNTMRELIDIQMEGCSEEELVAKQSELNKKYDSIKSFTLCRNG